MTRVRLVGHYAKALAAGAVAGLGALQVAYPGGVTGQEWIGVAIATIAGAGITAGVPNARRKR